MGANRTAELCCVVARAAQRQRGRSNVPVTRAAREEGASLLPLPLLLILLYARLTCAAPQSIYPNRGHVLRVLDSTVRCCGRAPVASPVRAQRLVLPLPCAALPQDEAALRGRACRAPHVHAGQGRPGQSQDEMRGACRGRRSRALAVAAVRLTGGLTCRTRSRSSRSAAREW
jgi:hypothetical protein